MGYRDDFYTMQNIIGYTGDIMGRPSVYFQRGNEYGHITQTHTLPFNIGREEVAYHAGYHIDNYFRRGKWRSIEWEGGTEVHTSRNPLIRRQFFNPGDLLTLGVAVYRFQDIKLRYQRGVMRQAHRKHHMQTQLKSLFAASSKDGRHGHNFAAQARSPRAAFLIEDTRGKTWT